MSDVVLSGVFKRYGRVNALVGADLTVPAGQLTAVLGPSGCGKTTLLRCLAGFERLDAGEIRIDGTLVAGGGRHLPAHRRNIAVVPQEGALFPHLSVAENVGYGLDRAARRSGRIDEVLTLVGLAGYGDRMPHQLSGGQQQRVAVARALAPRPSVVLLDEPFSALDAGLRTGLRHDVREALRADGATGVLVTHDQGEALSVADQVAVLCEGRVVQSAPPTTIYREPADPWVAGFVGDAMLLPAVVEQGAARTALGILPVTGATADGPATVLVRPEQLRFADGRDAVAATVLRHDFHGHDALIGLRLADGTQVTARILDGAAPVPLGGEVTVRVDGAARAFPARTLAGLPAEYQLTA
ncbi:iron(III) transport system ATP-binding protein [Micromonospora phaseoli]|uniref:ABC-type quaternary amine transporter n=1 Tax=Micromonospora phaseoli TaxID=1144548 RepID=A0A1H6S205_9ACTN|nr:ABC transporter ATP-binding protein [Micromonospora phaseoli]PZW03613.1 iron(III) transport system ATP-binding protein [Micromonospora phaseoli]GIJ81311.1 ABC transporter [Micromonospora phaseoli]SEI58070.1 iron(III) transport system ATP-binding protein [Micromonospora phaseoli]